MTVVKDNEFGLAAWLAPDTPLIRPILPDGRDIRDWDSDAKFGRRRIRLLDRWRGPGVLKIAPSSRPWSVWYFWDSAGSFSGWYVNVEDPHVRDHDSRAITTEDCVLDLVVSPARTVTRKDADELAAAHRCGTYDDERVAEIERWAADAVEAVTAWCSPFADDWSGWRPDASWTRPEPPDGYEATVIDFMSRQPG